MRKQYGLVISSGEGGIDNDTATKNFDSREFTFKYLDRKLYNGGVYKVNSADTIKWPAPHLIIPHNLGYAPSYRFYVYARDQNNNYANNNYQYELQQVNGSASVINSGAYMGRNNFYIFVHDFFGTFTATDVFFVLVIGADNLEADADETRWVS